MEMRCGVVMSVSVGCDPKQDGSFPGAPNRSRLILTGIIEVRVRTSGIQRWGFDSDELYEFKV